MMRRYRRAVIAMACCLTGGVPTLALAQLSTSGACPVENAQVSVNLNGMDQDVAAVRAKLDAKIAEVKSLAAQQSFTKVTVQSLSYNINSNFNGGDTRFQYNGNISFSILPAGKAVDFMELLTKKGYQASVNVSSYNNNGACSPRLDK
jgi:hypothetical protein